MICSHGRSCLSHGRFDEAAGLYYQTESDEWLMGFVWEGWLESHLKRHLRLLRAVPITLDEIRHSLSGPFWAEGAGGLGVRAWAKGAAGRPGWAGCEVGKGLAASHVGSHGAG